MALTSVPAPLAFLAHDSAATMPCGTLGVPFSGGRAGLLRLSNLCTLHRMHPKGLTFWPTPQAAWPLPTDLTFSAPLDDAMPPGPHLHRVHHAKAARYGVTPNQPWPHGTALVTSLVPITYSATRPLSAFSCGALYRAILATAGLLDPPCSSARGFQLASLTGEFAGCPWALLLDVGLAHDFLMPAPPRLCRWVRLL